MRSDDTGGKKTKAPKKSIHIESKSLNELDERITLLEVAVSALLIKAGCLDFERPSRSEHTTATKRGSDQ